MAEAEDVWLIQSQNKLIKMQLVSGCICEQDLFIQVQPAKGYPEEREGRFYSFG